MSWLTQKPLFQHFQQKLKNILSGDKAIFSLDTAEQNTLQQQLLCSVIWVTISEISSHRALLTFLRLQLLGRIITIQTGIRGCTCIFNLDEEWTHETHLLTSSLVQSRIWVHTSVHTSDSL